jgi:hypothetical protein
MQRLRHNILANYAGNAHCALLSIALVPLYIRFMGIEAYGLVGCSALWCDCGTPGHGTQPDIEPRAR